MTTMCTNAADLPIFDVCAFGADPTGETDSYDAFRAWAAAISAAKIGVGLVPAGRYLLDHVIDYDGTRPVDEVIAFVDCERILIAGEGALLTLGTGALQGQLPIRPTARTSMLCPFWIQNCELVVLQGFEIYGSADRVVDAEAFAAAPNAHGIAIRGCGDVLVREVRIHHTWADGINVDRAFDPAYAVVAGGRLTERVSIEESEIYACARSNVTVRSCRNVRFSGTKIHGAGDTGSLSYTPRRGVDLERDPGIVDPGSAETCVVESCDVFDNAGAALVVSRPFASVTVRTSRLSNEQDVLFPIFFASPKVTIADSTFRLGHGRIDVFIDDAVKTEEYALVMERCLVEASAGAGLYLSSQHDSGARALVVENRFINGRTSKDSPSFDAAPPITTMDDALRITARGNFVAIPLTTFPRARDGAGERRP